MAHPMKDQQNTSHPFKAQMEASKAAKKSAMDIDGETIQPGVQTVKTTVTWGSGQTKDTQKIPTRKEGGRVCMDDDAPARKRGDRPAFATGGAVKAKKGTTTVNVIVAPSGAGAPPPMGPPPMDMGPPPGPMGPPPGMDMGPPPGPMGPPPGMPMRAAGGRVAKKFMGGPHTGGAMPVPGGVNPAPAVMGGAPVAPAPTGAIGTGMGAGRPPSSGMLGRPTGRPRPGISGGVAPGAGGIVAQRAAGGAIGTGLKGSAPSASLGGKPRPPSVSGRAPGAGGMIAMRKHGGKVDGDGDGDHDCSPQGKAGSGSGLGRLNKAKAAKHD